MAADYYFRHQRKRNPSQISPTASQIAPASIPNVLLSPPPADKTLHNQQIAIAAVTSPLDPPEKELLKEIMPDSKQPSSMEPINSEPDPSKPTQPVSPLKDKTEKDFPVISINDFSAVDMNGKLNLLMVAINKINTNFHLKFEAMNEHLYMGEHSFVKQIESAETTIVNISEVLNDEREGILPRMRDAESSLEDVQDRLEKLETKCASLQDQIVSLKGAAQVHDNQIHSTARKVIDLTARSMSCNIIIQGIVSDPGNMNEDCKTKVLEFMRNKMSMDLQDSEVLVAHRLGYKKTTRSCNIVVKCDQALWDRVFKYTKNLKDLKNPDGNFYKVSSQLPEPLHTERQERQDKIAQINRLNK